MKYSEISSLQVQELRKRLAQSQQALFDARMKHKMQRLSNIMELRNHRRDIARLRTALSALPESAFVSERKKPVVGADSVSAPSDSKLVSKSVKKSAVPVKEKFAKKEKQKEKQSDVLPSAKKHEQKKDVKPSVGVKVKQPVSGVASSVKEKREQKTARKKWFGFFGSGQKQSSQDMQAGAKRSFFRRKSG